MNTVALGPLALALAAAPLLPGLINRVKAFFAGRRGPPLFQLYYDLAKLLRKGAVYSRTTTWVFRASPAVGVAAGALALALLPSGGTPALLAFPGDFVLLVYLLGLARFFLVLAALDTGSSFEGLGASREVAFSALAEPAFLIALAALARASGSLSLSGLLGAGGGELPVRLPLLLLAAAALMLVLLTENARVPVDDPNTHLELTMLHEVLVLDYSGPDLAFALYAAALKLWLFGAVLVRTLTGWLPGSPALQTAIFLAGLVTVALAVGVIESCMARLRLTRVPHLLIAANAFALLAVLLGMRQG
ncbi:MAG: NADH-quinone oxidoreductase subunit H [Kiritimatiellaeota bacterium]|nr:NADH-quinone oxidoreductase subunit H [Kiritimatiellota bacterium]